MQRVFSTSFGISALCILIVILFLLTYQLMDETSIRPTKSHMRQELQKVKKRRNRNAVKLKQLSLDDLNRIALNLGKGTKMNKLIHPENMSDKLRKYFLHGKKLRHKINQVMKERQSNASGASVIVDKPMKSNTIIYNRINKSGSSSLLCESHKKIVAREMEN